jgi:hypothetical protein
MISFDFFLKLMMPCLSKLKVTLGFCFPNVIPGNMTASIKYITLSFLKCCATTYKKIKLGEEAFKNLLSIANSYT